MEVTSGTPSYGECFASLALGLAPIFLLLGVSALFGANTVTSGGQNVHGIGALFVSVVLIVVFAAIFAGLQKLGYVILGHLRRKRSQVDA
ncbi:MAG TPA: hypothetical protein VMN38_03420 [Sphingomicrobium sp.]|nr:hypothetical protein [Sphingomicrobium sp.]